MNRIVAGTNQDLDAAVTAGRFRQDLFHRLSQSQLRVRALRERPEDIVALAEHFLSLQTPSSSFSPDAISALLWQLFEQLQHWSNQKMKDDGWELPTGPQ
ncbi:MAG: sigma 54-interacting transcriptional regulator [Candidatus Sulfotelmatobacter sp.]